jgi:hypothetical protein
LRLSVRGGAGEDRSIPEGGERPMVVQWGSEATGAPPHPWVVGGQRAGPVRQRCEGDENERRRPEAEG